jgi:hypothetical protein
VRLGWKALRSYCQGAQPDRCQMTYAASAFTRGS